MGVSNEKTDETKPVNPPPGYSPLAEIANVNGIGRRQLWLRVRSDPESFDAVQTEGGRWYLPADIMVEHKRTKITPELEARIRRAWLDTKPAVIAQRENVATSTVYKIGNKYDVELREERLEREKDLEKISGSSEIVGMHLYGKPYPYIKAVDVEANRESLAQFPRLGEDCYFDPLRRVLRVSPDRLREVVKWEDERKLNREELDKRVSQRYSDYKEPGK